MLESDTGRCGSGAVVVAAAIIERAGKVLIARRPEGVHLAMLWEFPGGKREPGEDLRTCLAREIAEELGTTLDIPEAAWRVVRHRYPEKLVEIHFFRCRLTGREPRALGAAEIAWVGRGELSAREFPAADAGIISELQGLPANS